MSPTRKSEADRWDAEAVAGLRYRLGMTQHEFSRALGVRQQTVSEWETGLHQPRGASRRMLTVVAEQRADYAVGQRRGTAPLRPGSGQASTSSDRALDPRKGPAVVAKAAVERAPGRSA